jgi:diaminohydroxyphosphoribosylaminopyrimidine deaminase/5-amino-6-(5-phosphoribosylamino)uracil reductase
MVGAVLVQGDVKVGEGYHHRAGEPHAEVMALRAAGDRARGATMYVSLEPCCHHGRTPPCTDAILAAGVQRVVAAMLDPFPKVAGGGIAALRAAGVEVTVGVLESEARRLNEAFLKAVTRGLPFVTLKAAMTLDGKIAAYDGASRWITGEAARREAHRLRSESDAVVVGIGTALADDPALDVRLDRPWPREPWRVVVDSQARLPGTARVLTTGTPARALVAVTDAAPAERLAALEATGATVLACKSANGHVDLVDLAGRLFALDVVAMLLEGGAELNAGFIAADLVDRVAVFVAPKLVGGRETPTPVGGPGRSLGEAVALTRTRARAVGDDWLIEGDVIHTDGG